MGEQTLDQNSRIYMWGTDVNPKDFIIDRNDFIKNNNINASSSPDVSMNNPPDKVCDTCKCCMTEEDARKFFNEFKNDSSIPWKYSNDCCYAKAHYMVYRILHSGWGKHCKPPIVGKIWVRRKDGQSGYDQELEARAKQGAQGGVINFHVAATVWICDKDGKQSKKMVIDPTLYDDIVSSEAWMKNSQFIHGEKTFGYSNGLYPTTINEFVGRDHPQLKHSLMSDNLPKTELYKRFDEHWSAYNKARRD